jgi:hypothetical protein
MPTNETISTTKRLHRKNATGQFAKGSSGNPAGRPPGSRNQATLLMEALLEGEAEQLTRKAIEMAAAGDIHALRLCLERLIAPRRERPIHLALPAARSAQQIAAALNAITTAIAEGQITPNEGEALANVLAMQGNVLQQGDFERRLERLEQKVAEEKAPHEQPESTHEDLSES